MTLHVSSKLFVVVLVVAALITAFRAPAKPISLLVEPGVVLAKSVTVVIKPQVAVSASRPLETPIPIVEIQPIVQEPVAKEPIVEAPSVEVPVVEAPIVEEPVIEPVAEAPVLEESVASTLHYTLKSTAYNSHVDQTDATPHLTATGATTAFGVIAISRDMLGSIPYGSLVRLKDLGSYRSGRGEGKFQELLDTQDLFIVEDTMHPRKLEQIDVWFADESEALSWGVRKVELEVVRVGRDGPMLEPTVVATQ
jgi:3D (Asp-Asp-Asp) domain-containing protein